MNHKGRIKWQYGVTALAVSAIWLFVISPRIRLGFFGTFLGELVFLVIAVVTVLISKLDLKEIFALKKPSLLQSAGTLLLYGSTLSYSMIIMGIITYFFPVQVQSSSEGVTQMIWNLPVIVSLFLVGVIPAVCEEALFRGVFLSSLKGLENKWIMIAVSGGVFGAFHGSIWRFIPTALIGMMIGYIVLETGNIFYGMLFHFINNAVPILLQTFLRLYETFYRLWNRESLSVQTSIQMPLFTIGIFLIMGVGIPLGLYAGNYLLHGNKDKYQREFLSGVHKKVWFYIFIPTIGLLLAGFIVIMLSAILDRGWIRQLI